MDTVLLPQIKSWISKKTGLRIVDNNEASFLRLIQARIKHFKLESMADYYQLLHQFSPVQLASEHEHLSRELTTGETYFFRDQGQFALLRQHILPELIERNRSKRQLRIWSAGCSSGEEPYSLAILLDELNAGLSDWQIIIHATDINPEALIKARESLYREWSFRQMSEQRRQRYFQQSEGHWILKPAIRQHVNFQQLNLVSDYFPNTIKGLSEIDLILCRNVFIYLESSMVSQITDKMTATLVEGGYLMTGHGELFAHHHIGLRTLVFPESIIYQKSTVTHHTPPKPTKPVAVNKATKTITPLSNAKISAKKNIPHKAKTNNSTRQQAIPAYTMQDAWNFANQGQSEKALSVCKEFNDKSPFQHQPYYLKALLAHELGNDEEAKLLLKKVIYLAPEYIAAYLELADIYSKENQNLLADKMRTTACELLQKLPPNANIETFGNSTAIEILQFVKGLI